MTSSTYQLTKRTTTKEWNLLTTNNYWRNLCARITRKHIEQCKGCFSSTWCFRGGCFQLLSKYILDCLLQHNMTECSPMWSVSIHNYLDIHCYSRFMMRPSTDDSWLLTQINPTERNKGKDEQTKSYKLQKQEIQATITQTKTKKQDRYICLT